MLTFVNLNEEYLFIHNNKQANPSVIKRQAVNGETKTITI